MLIGSACSSHSQEEIFMTRVLQLCALAGIVTGLLALTVPASAQTGWTVVPPPAGTSGDELTGSYALSNTDAWAVGYNGNTSTGPENPVVLNWNGTAWSSVSTPTPSGSTPDWGFYSVAASGTSDAWAVGEQSAGTKIHDSLYEHWNGTAWSVVSGPNEGKLTAVLDFSPTNAYAFANFAVLHWNATAWAVVSGAVPALQVSADSPGDIWGIYRNDMVTHYNGTSWSTYTLSAPSGTPVFEGVAAISPSPLPADSDVSISSAASSSSHVWMFGTGPNSDNPLILSNDS